MARLVGLHGHGAWVYRPCQKLPQHKEVNEEVTRARGASCKMALSRRRECASPLTTRTYRLLPESPSSRAHPLVHTTSVCGALLLPTKCCSCVHATRTEHLHKFTPNTVAARKPERRPCVRAKSPLIVRRRMGKYDVSNQSRRGLAHPN